MKKLILFTAIISLIACFASCSMKKNVESDLNDTYSSVVSSFDDDTSSMESAINGNSSEEVSSAENQTSSGASSEPLL